MAFKLPWSNFHELNLDWLLEKVKDLEKAVAGITGSADPSNDPPVMDGTASAGSSANYSRGDHVHPTDTSRASASDLSDLDTREYNDYVQLQGDINTVDAKIAFSSAAPLMDSGSPSSGSSPYQARADHVHPTDTSRASAVDVALLEARMDAFSGSATPSNTAPVMNGTAAAGVSNSYSRGDHVHPSDTNKLDTAGGTVYGPLEVRGQLTEVKKTGIISTSAIGWVRVANVPVYAGTMVEFTIARKGSATPSEVHKIVMTINDDVTFYNELSNSSQFIINKIRYTSAGYVDIHIDQVYASSIRVDIVPHTAKSPVDIEIGTMEYVADSPIGETIVAEHSFRGSGYYLDAVNVGSINGVGFAQGLLPTGTPKDVPIAGGRYMLFISSYASANVGIWAVNCSGSAGTVSVYKVSSAAAGNITLEPGTNLLTITSASREATYALMNLGS